MCDKKYNINDDHNATNGETNEANTKHIASNTSSLTTIPNNAMKWINQNPIPNKCDIHRYKSHISIMNMSITALNQKNFQSIILLLLMFLDANRKIVFCDISCCSTLAQKKTTKIIQATSTNQIQKSLITLACSLKANHQATIVDIISSAQIHAII